MNAKHIHTLLQATVGLCLLVTLGGVYAANSVLKKQGERLEGAKLVSAVLNEQQDNLIKQRTNIVKYRELSKVARQIVPQDKDQAQTVREIIKIADASGVKIASLTFPNSDLGGAKASQELLSQLKPVKNISGVYNLEITVQSHEGALTPYDRLLQFLEGLESNRRTALVTGITLSPDVGDPGLLTFNLKVNEYIKP